MTWSVRVLPQAEEDLDWFRRHDLARYVKCFDLVRSVAQDPRSGIGKPERLRHFGDTEVWSRRVSLEDRMVYTVYQGSLQVDVSSCRQHCE